MTLVHKRHKSEHKMNSRWDAHSSGLRLRGLIFRAACSVGKGQLARGQIFRYRGRADNTTTTTYEVPKITRNNSRHDRLVILTRCLHFTARCTTGWVNYMQTSLAKRREVYDVTASQQGGCVDSRWCETFFWSNEYSKRFVHPVASWIRTLNVTLPIGHG